MTTWSKLGVNFSGVSVDTLLAAAEPLPAATHVLAFSHTGYTTNLPLADVTGGQAWVVWDFEGQPLPTVHGGPARLLVPHLYFWKSAKWVAGLAAARPRRARVLGAERLPRPWATPGSSSATRVTESAPWTPPQTDEEEGDRDCATKRTPWQTATVIGIRPETARAKTFRFCPP